MQNDLQLHIEKSRSLAYKHIQKANSISEVEYANLENDVYGLKFNFDGNTATSTQFYLTDSVNHFFRGAFYFSTEINDSIKVIEEYLNYDMINVIETFYWK